MPFQPPAEPAERKLADFLCFAVYSTNLAFGRVYRPILDALGLTYTQYVTMIALFEEDGQTVSSLGEKLFLESNTLTPILKKLEGMGYVQRVRDAVDERQVRVCLTDEGRRLDERTAHVNLTDACGLTGEQFAALRAQIIELRSHLIAAGRAQP